MICQQKCLISINGAYGSRRSVVLTQISSCNHFKAVTVAISLVTVIAVG